MRRKNLDLVVAVIIAGMNVGWALLGNRFPLIGVTLALPLVFVLPGYMLTEAFFHKRPLNVSHRLLLSLGLSLSIVVLSGLLLNLLPAGLRATTWAIFLGLLTALLSLLVAYIRRGTPLNETHPLRFRFSISGFVLFSLAIVIATLSVLYAVIGAERQSYSGFTQLSMLPSVQTEKSCAIHLGIRSFESTTVTYRIILTINKTQVTPWPSIVLAPQEAWNRSMPITPGVSSSVNVEAQLYRLDKPSAAYREVHVTLSSCPTSQVTPTSKTALVSAYTGTIHDIPTNLTTKMSLIRVQQSGGNMSGYLTLGSGLQGSEPFKGTITTKQIQFTVTSDTGQSILSFEGVMQSLGTISGSYCSTDQEARCNGDQYGIWSDTPTST